jgi:hypothetical protein
MHSLFSLAGILALIAMAFGARAASVVAAVILMAGTVVMVGFILIFAFGKGM